ncbi:hypothetical protein KP509_10G043900 [Ceratopteris richardii]|uniref:Dirigent protein n=1 Tax=Ceratopteris richardii TaxID=49495 RepID=A0A8T2U0J2_CERRI|nr:hypothetical protein KP509_10G043900 [Ceratopteris richardii]
MAHQTQVLEKLVALGVILSVVTAHLLGVAEASNEPLLFMSHNFTYYVQVEMGAPGLDIAAPPINPGISANFGQLTMFAFNATEGQSRMSKPLGFVRGYTVETSYVSGDMQLLEVEFLEYNDGRYNGTIQYQGAVTPEGTELAIVGGSGSFRGVRGYLVVTFSSSDPPFSTFRHDVTLLE